MSKQAELPRILIVYLFYLAIIPFVVAAALINDARAFNASTDAYLHSSSAEIVIPIIIVFIIYWLRLSILLLPLAYLKKKWHIMTSLGAALAFIPEAWLCIWALQMFQTYPSDCSNSFGGCGWGLLLLLPIGAATILQFIGMGIGALVAYFKK